MLGGDQCSIAASIVNFKIQMVLKTKLKIRI